MSSAYKCPNCGAALEVIAGRTDVTCATCGAVTNLSELLARMSYVELPKEPDRMGPLNLFLLVNRLGGCGCVAALVMACIVVVFILVAISLSVPGGFSGYLTQTAH